MSLGEFISESLLQAYHVVTIHHQEARNELSGIIQNQSQIDNKVDVLHRFVLNFQFYYGTDILLIKTIYMSLLLLIFSHEGETNALLCTNI